MSAVIGIDIGGSTTKIVGFRKEEKEVRTLIPPLFVRATDPMTSMYGAFGKFTQENNLSLSDIEKVMMTGVGSSFMANTMYGLPCETVPEFKSIGLGGLYLSGLEHAIIVSLGTGTAVVYAQKGKEMEYMGGTGVGGGTLVGLSKRMLGVESMEHIELLAEKGNLDNVDLRVGDITKQDMYAAMSNDLTASNFGKLSDMASKEDVALGLMNMVFETVAMVSLFAARSKGVRDIVLTGNLITLPYAKVLFPSLSSMFDINFIIPENAQFSTVIGTALCG